MSNKIYNTYLTWHDIVADIMPRTRASYHFAVHYVQKNYQDIIKDRFAIVIIDNHDRDFCREAKN
jgi:hypothetical protein